MWQRSAVFVFLISILGSLSHAGPINNLKQSLKERLRPFEVQYLTGAAGVEVLSCQLMDAESGMRITLQMEHLVDCGVEQVFDQILTGQQRVAILANLKFLKSPEQQSRTVLFNWSPVQLEMNGEFPSAESAFIVAFLIRVKHVIDNIHDTRLTVRSLEGGIPISWLVEDASPFRAAFVGLGGEIGEPAIEKLELLIKTQKAGEPSVSACQELQKLPISMKRMCAELKVYAQGEDAPGLTAHMQYGWRKSEAQVEEKRRAIESRLHDVVNSGSRLFWPTPSSEQVAEMATRSTPQAFDAEFRFQQSR